MTKHIDSISVDGEYFTTSGQNLVLMFSGGGLIDLDKTSVDFPPYGFPVEILLHSVEAYKEFYNTEYENMDDLVAVLSKWCDDKYISIDETNEGEGDD